MRDCSNEKLKEEICQLQVVVDWLCKHDRYDVVITPTSMGDTVLIKWLYNSTVKAIRQPYSFINSKILKSTGDTIVLSCNDRFYEINKENMDLTEVHEPAFVLEKELANKDEIEQGQEMAELIRVIDVVEKCNYGDLVIVECGEQKYLFDIDLHTVNEVEYHKVAMLMAEKKYEMGNSPKIVRLICRENSL